MPCQARLGKGVKRSLVPPVGGGSPFRPDGHLLGNGLGIARHLLVQAEGNGDLRESQRVELDQGKPCPQRSPQPEVVMVPGRDGDGYGKASVLGAPEAKGRVRQWVSIPAGTALAASHDGQVSGSTSTPSRVRPSPSSGVVSQLITQFSI